MKRKCSCLSLTRHLNVWKRYTIEPSVEMQKTQLPIGPLQKGLQVQRARLQGGIFKQRLLSSSYGEITAGQKQFEKLIPFEQGFKKKKSVSVYWIYLLWLWCLLMLPVNAPVLKTFCSWIEHYNASFTCLNKMSWIYTICSRMKRQSHCGEI